MQTAPPKPPSKTGLKPGQGGRGPRNMLSSRSGTMALALIVAVMGGGAILVFLQQYRESVDEGARPVTVLVAKSLIGKGTSGDLVAGEDLFQTSQIAESEVKDGAIKDPATLRGKVSVRDVFPGQQLTTADFSGTSDAVGSRLTQLQRAISVPVDTAHGLVGVVQTGDHVDVLTGFTVERDGDAGRARPVVRALVQDVLVLKGPKSSSGRTSGTATSQAVLRVTDEQAAAIAFASEYGKVWLTLRPPTGATQSRPSLVTLESLLVGLRPIELREGRR